MSKKTLALIIALLVLTIVLLAVALYTKNTPPAPEQPNQNEQAKTPTPTPFAHTVLSMSPNPVVPPVGSASATTVSVNINTNGDDVNAVQLEIAYDPTLLRSMSIKPGDFFNNPNVLPVGGVDQKTGRITFMVVPSSIKESKRGTGTVATLIFYPVRNGTASTEIKLLDKSLVTSFGQSKSVLASESGTKVLLSTQPANTKQSAMPSSSSGAVPAQ